MARYKVLVDSVIGSGIVKAGEIIEYDGESEGTPGSNLELIPDPAHARFDTEQGKAAGNKAAAK